jgi:hypothetical protein
LEPKKITYDVYEQLQDYKDKNKVGQEINKTNITKKVGQIFELAGVKPNILGQGSKDISSLEYLQDERGNLDRNKLAELYLGDQKFSFSEYKETKGVGYKNKDYSNHPVMKDPKFIEFVDQSDILFRGAKKDLQNLSNLQHQEQKYASYDKAVENKLNPEYFGQLSSSSKELLNKYDIQSMQDIDEILGNYFGNQAHLQNIDTFDKTSHEMSVFKTIKKDYDKYKKGRLQGEGVETDAFVQSWSNTDPNSPDFKINKAYVDAYKEIPLSTALANFKYSDTDGSLPIVETNPELVKYLEKNPDAKIERVERAAVGPGTIGRGTVNIVLKAPPRKEMKLGQWNLPEITTGEGASFVISDVYDTNEDRLQYLAEMNQRRIFGNMQNFYYNQDAGEQLFFDDLMDLGDEENEIEEEEKEEILNKINESLDMFKRLKKYN